MMSKVCFSVFINLSKNIFNNEKITVSVILKIKIIFISKNFRLKKLLKTDPNRKKASKSSSLDSSNNGDSSHFREKQSNKPSQTDESTKNDYTKHQNNEEENKSFHDKNKNGFLSSAKPTLNQNFINEEEYKNRDNRKNTSKAPNTTINTNNTTNNNNTNKNSSNNNLINVNTNINNKTFSNVTNLSAAGNSNSNSHLNGKAAKNTTNVNFKYDPTTNQIKDVNVKVDMDAETAYKLCQDNKKYLPTTQQVISGAKISANFVQNSGVLNEIGNAGSSGAATQAKKKTGVDPLSSLFGSSLSKGTSGSDKNPAVNADSKKGKF
jgi:hypothetical protein